MSTTSPRWLPRFLAATLLPAFVYALPGAAPVQAHAADPADYQQVTLAKGPPEVGEPISLAVLPDRSVLHTSRDGTLRRTDASGNTTIAGKLAVYSHDEEGLQGVGVDPGFAANRFVYLYYAPKLNTPAGDAPQTGTDADFAPWRGVNRLSRFELEADGTLDLASETRILDVPADRGVCCHVGGDIDFDAAGNLYLSTGDDTNPFISSGYSPLDERADRNPAYDAQRTAANTNDLRGKVLRIKVDADGSYAVPAGNMFPPGTPKTRPEIYAMGLRNPFRMNVDKPTGAVYIGEYGPDAGKTDPDRGPHGQVEVDRITGPGFFGWPYCTGTNTVAETYNDYDFATGSSGAKFDCGGGAHNGSPRNTGLATLPPAKPAWVKYNGCSAPEFDCPDNRKNDSPMGIPVYRHDPALNSEVKFPADLDGHVFLGEFGRRWIKTIGVNADGSRGAVDPFPWQGTQIIDMAFGPDGALYVLDYGTGQFEGDEHSALYRIEHVRGRNRAPVAAASADKTSGVAPLTVRFSAAGSSDPEGGALTYAWDFGDGGTATGADTSHTFSTNGQYTATLTARDPQGATGTANVIVTVGNTAPAVTLDLPRDGQLFEFGDTVPFRVTVTDREDGSVDCAKVEVTYVLGHDSHGHPITSATGCSGSIKVPRDGEHDESANLFGVFDAQYTDRGANGQPPLTTHAQHIVQPRHRQAEHYSSAHGVTLVGKDAAEGGRTVGYIDNGDWIAFNRYLLAGTTSFEARVSSGGIGGTLSLRAGSPTGPLLGSTAVPVTGGWETFTTVTGTVHNAPPGTTDLYLVFTGGDGALFDVDAFTFGTDAPQPDPPADPQYQVLVFSKTAGYRHDSISTGVQAVKDLGAAHDFAVTATENGNVFTAKSLSRYAAVVFLNTTGDILDDSQQAAFEAYIGGGGGFVGIHSAADTEYGWPFYGDLVGAYFASHPAVQPATIKVEDRAHPATAHLGQTWRRTDEWYDYRTNARSTARVLATLDESSYNGGMMGADHPHAWCKEYRGGRAFYTGGGHTKQAYADPAFRGHMLGGLRYAAGQVRADCRPRTP